MAKNKENQLTYLQSPLPEGRRYSRMLKRSWSGLNYRQTIDTGALSKEKNISTLEAPYLVPSQAPWDYVTGYGKSADRVPISMFGFDDFLILVYREGDYIKVDYIKHDPDSGKPKIYTGIVCTGASEDDTRQRCVVQFNVYDTPTDPVTGEYIKKLLIFPDKASMFMNIVEVDSNPADWKQEDIDAADPKVMYCYEGEFQKRAYFTVKVTSETNEESGDIKYSRKVESSGGNGCFECDGMDVEIRTYKNTTAETDLSGATIYPPPENADPDFYYQNIVNADVYTWTQYEYEYENEDGETEIGKAYGWKVCAFPNMPDIKYAAVHLSRLFGVDDDRVYASGYNDYTNWNLDSVGEYNESNAWCSPAQSNTRAGGAFTGITNFQGHIVCFKRDYMHEIYNTKNPFRIQDVYAEGAIDNRTIQDVDGKLIFVSEDNVKIYTGSNPRIISHNLNISKFENAVSGSDGRCYYLYCHSDGHRLLTYDTYTECWSEQHTSNAVLSFAHNRNGMFMLCDDGRVYKLDTGDYNLQWSFETDLITNETVNIKHLKKIQMLADIPSADNESANLQVYVLYGDESFNAQTSHCVYRSEGYGRKTIRVRPRNKKNATYGIKLHIEGSKYVKLYEMELFIEAGGDSYVGN